MRKVTNIELKRLSLEQYKNLEKFNVTIVADNIRSLNNIGSLFRTCDAFAMQGIYLCGITATPPNKEIHKTALGAENSVEWRFFNSTKDAVTELKNRGYTILAVEQVENSVMLDELNIDSKLKYALVFGNEVNGVDQNVVDICDGYIEIPQIGTKHSLNVSVSAGVVLWEFFRQLSSQVAK